MIKETFECPRPIQGEGPGYHIVWLPLLVLSKEFGINKFGISGSALNFCSGIRLYSVLEMFRPSQAPKRQRVIKRERHLIQSMNFNY